MQLARGASCHVQHDAPIDAAMLNNRRLHHFGHLLSAAKLRRQ
jgi:hypothetical protein